MQMFLTDRDQLKCAEALDDGRLGKAVLDISKIIDTVVGGKNRTTNTNHPCVKWSAKTRTNFDYTCTLGVMISEEYGRRFACLHPQHDALLLSLMGREGVPPGPLLPFVNATHFQDMDVKYAYRHTLNNKWDADKRTPTWTLRRPPQWARFRSVRVENKYVYCQEGKERGV